MDGFNFFESSFPVLFEIAFFGILAVFVVVVIRGLLQWNKNNHSPKLSVAARVVSKREDVSHHTSDDQHSARLRRHPDDRVPGWQEPQSAD